MTVKLRELTRAGIITFWCFIHHLPEDDEGGKKEHNHVYIEPSHLLQTDDLRSQFEEFDPDKPDKPRGCLSFSSSKFADWYLYGLHDPRYLAMKGQSRKYHYHADDMCPSDEDELIFRVKSIDLLSLSRFSDMEDAQSQGLTYPEYFARGTVPIQQVKVFEAAWNTLLANKKKFTYRNGRKNHPMDVDEETGEIHEED